MIESLRVLKACRKTAVAARRVALQMIHNTIICAPDDLRDTLRKMTRMQLVRTLASWRPDLTDYRTVISAYRISLKSLGRRYLELHDEIADLDAMIGAIVDELAPTSWPGTRLVTQVPHSCFLQPGTIRSAYTLRLALPRFAVSAQSQPRPARRRVIASIEGATEPPTAPCTSLPSAGSGPIREPRPIWPSAWLRAIPSLRRSDVSNATSLARCSP